MRVNYFRIMKPLAIFLIHLGISYEAIIMKTAYTQFSLNDMDRYLVLSVHQTQILLNSVLRVIYRKVALWK